MLPKCLPWYRPTESSLGVKPREPSPLEMEAAPYLQYRISLALVLIVMGSVRAATNDLTVVGQLRRAVADGDKVDAVCARIFDQFYVDCAKNGSVRWTKNGMAAQSQLTVPISLDRNSLVRTVVS